MIKQFFKKVLISYLIIICCIFTPTYRAYAASPAGWAFNRYDVATSVVTALKGGASASVAVAKSPVSQKIAKGIVGGVIAGAALPLAISQITGIALESLDWVLDPANNAIKYKDKNPPAPVQGADCGGKIIITGYSSPYEFASFADALADISTRSGYSLGSPIRPGVYPVGYGAVLYCETVIQPQNDYKTIPIPTVSDKIYDNAKTDTASASIVNDAVKDYVNSGAADVALDTAKADADATHACGTGTSWNGSACVADTPATPDTPFDPSSIIDAIKGVFDAVMSLPDVINSALDDLLVDIKDFFQPVIDTFTDFVDWVKQEPTTESPTQPDITPLPMPPTDSVDISFDGGCPAPNVVPWSLAGQNVDITISYTPICDTATLLNPIIKLAASLGAVFIIAGIRRGDDG